MLLKDHCRAIFLLMFNKMNPLEKGFNILNERFMEKIKNLFIHRGNNNTLEAFLVAEEYLNSTQNELKRCIISSVKKR